MRQIRSDVVVIGTGMAGLSAALTTAEGGAKVVLFEKRRTPGALSLWLCGLALMRKDEALRDRAFQVWMESTHSAAEASVLRAVIDRTSQLEEWLVDHGVLQHLNARPESLTSLETMGKNGGIGGGLPSVAGIFDWYFCDPAPTPVMVKMLYDKALSLGVDAYLSTPAKKILKDRGEITGVIAETAAGETIQVEARAVVVATNGFQENKSKVKELGFDLDLDGSGFDGDLSVMAPNLGLTGDGMEMASAVGADTGPLGLSLCNNVPGPGITGQTKILQDQQYLWVNQSGKRFVNEDIMPDRVMMANKIADQKPRCAYLIFDDDTRVHLEKDGPEWCYYVRRKYLPLADIQGQFVEMIGRGNKNVFLADSLEELSQQTGTDRANLEKTVTEYNRCCDQGHDDMYAKNPKFLRPLRKPKFYALRNTCWVYETIGGIRINERGEALTRDLEVIPGLYAAGSIALGVLFNECQRSNFSGLTLSWALGSIAGEAALERVRA